MRRTRRQLYEHINGDYYGFRDEEDGVLERVEAQAEAAMLAQARAQWQRDQEERAAAGGVDVRTLHGGKDGRGDAFTAHVPLPERGQIEALVVAKKKAELLARYQSAELTEEEAAARKAVNAK